MEISFGRNIRPQKTPAISISLKIDFRVAERFATCRTIFNISHKN